jgi:exodeoxyribonuclease VII large subunit
LRAVCAAGVDVVLLVRGGGSFEDLMPFNDEVLAREVAACPVPVITGIGHEPDTSIADMVADLRASTPTAAAEAVSSPTVDGLRKGFDNALTRISRALSAQVAQEAGLLRVLAAHPVLSDPGALLAQEAQALDAASDRLHRAIPLNLERDRRSLEHAEGGLLRRGATLCAAGGAQLDAATLQLRHAGASLLQPHERAVAVAAARLNDLSPLAVLSRGYAIARDDGGHVVKSVDDVSSGDGLRVRVSDGELNCMVR